MFLLAAVLYRSGRKRKKANFILARKNIEIQQKNEEISAQRDEIESQRDLVTLQKDHIEKMHEDVTSSIRYAKRIQNAVLPSSEQLNSIVPEYFILFMPRNIVSGDFYWITRAKNHIIFCVADCTGHGVPGAFMSLMGISYLNEIIIKEALTDPSKILDRLRAEVINSLKQKGEQDEQKDGMDIALCSMNIQTSELWFAGANNPLYIIRNNELIEFKGDKMPISIHERMNSFTLNENKLKKNDCLYLVTDGFADQFGSGDKKKFSRKSLKNLILENSPKPMAEQKKIFYYVLNDWKGNSPQIDDITLMGIKI
jgi:serine phosphatase RsbU (regulator of sigma subunit)